MCSMSTWYHLPDSNLYKHQQSPLHTSGGSTSLCHQWHLTLSLEYNIQALQLALPYRTSIDTEVESPQTIHGYSLETSKCKGTASYRVSTRRQHKLDASTRINHTKDIDQGPSK